MFHAASSRARRFWVPEQTCNHRVEKEKYDKKRARLSTTMFHCAAGAGGGPEVTATLTIYRNEGRYDDPPSDDSRLAGLLIKGRRAIYENTLFRFENSPMAGWFSGRVECPYIDQLATEYDARFVAGQPQDKRNPVPIITRSRDGLQQTHPFYKALATAVEKPLGELVREEEKKSKESSGHESSETRRTLDTLGRDLARLIDEDLRELEEEGLIGGGETGSAVPPMRLIPEQAVLYMGEDRPSPYKSAPISS